jgi:electron transfer flavoprotein-quinone oxidoreductase
MSDDADVVVVGAGPAGAACAYVLARAGRAVLLVERAAAPGAKNVSGGRLYTSALDVLEPGLAARVPAERAVVAERIGVLDERRAAVLATSAPTRPDGGPQSVTVLRPVLDAWLADLAEQQGATLLPGVVVDGPVTEDGRVVGIRAGGEELRAATVVAADGTSSLLARAVGLVRAPVAGQVATGVKEVVDLPAGAIEERFGVAPGEGVAQLMVGCTRGLHGGGFLYTNATSVALGIVVDPGGLAAAGTTPRDLLEDLRAHPAVAPLLRGGRVVEYAAHLVREDGLAGVPRRLTAPGFLVTGEAAGFVLNLGYTVRGMDLAILSGVAAAEAVLAGGDLKTGYRAALRRTGVAGAMSSARRGAGLLAPDRIYRDYPRLALDSLGEIFTVGGPERVVPRVRRRFSASPVRMRDAAGDVRRAVRAL